MSKRKVSPNITQADVGMLYLNLEGGVFELVALQVEPNATMRPLIGGADHIEPVSSFDTFVRLIPESQVARRKKPAPAVAKRGRPPGSKAREKPSLTKAFGELAAATGIYYGNKQALGTGTGVVQLANEPAS